MNKIFKTKYDVTTGQTKVVSELASNRQLASSSAKTPKCGSFSTIFLSLFKLLPLAFLLNGSFVYGQDGVSNIQLDGITAEEEKVGFDTIWRNSKPTNFISKVGEKSVVLGMGSIAFVYKKNKNFGNSGGGKL